MPKSPKKEKVYPCPHGREPMNGQNGYLHCPHCLGVNAPTKKEGWESRFDQLRLNLSYAAPEVIEDNWKAFIRDCRQEAYEQGIKDGQARMDNSGRMMFQAGEEAAYKDAAEMLNNIIRDYAGKKPGEAIDDIKKRLLNKKRPK